MRRTKNRLFSSVFIATFGMALSWLPPALADSTSSASPIVGVAPQYDTTHVYVDPRDFGKFVDSLLATFGGTRSKQGVFTVTPTPSKTMSQLVLTHAGSVSVFGFVTSIPYPFGAERTGYRRSPRYIAAKRAPQNRRAIFVFDLLSPNDVPPSGNAKGVVGYARN